ncbi:glycosyltransferase [Microlunatus flavus]|uniref:Glycosyltransferase like family protein n=1 Tax=Microlunatus flavus TaxID=1036181 RepID=A0A1H9DGR0_9ACTN|nr:glycosyltransferase [Microlunatus flavus]SEQ12676.1 Glycosyltransferase like family protein [Microlunatus flavus]
MAPTGDRSAAGISIVCVFNDPAVRTECLDSSVAAYRGDLDVDYIPVDNTTHRFTSAGAALNHGASLARHPLVVFVHQDVYLHSIDRLVEAGSHLEGGRWGVLGANGVTDSGLNVGRLRDRTQLIGEHAPEPVEVQTLDEVLFMVRREQVLEHPLTEDPDLAWHAYAVEYSLRVVGLGLAAGAVDLAVTHNSLSINMARLDVAHGRVGELYPTLRPICTTCGTIGAGSSRLRRTRLVRAHGWRLRWLRHSLLARRARRRLQVPVVLSDIREEVDLLEPGTPLRLVDVDRAGGFVEHGREPLRLTRFGRPVTMSAVSTVAEVPDVLAGVGVEEIVLVVGLDLDDLADAALFTTGDRPWLLGIYPDEMWLLGGLPLDRLPEAWSRRAAQPLGGSTLVA